MLVQAELSRKHLDLWELRRQATDILTLLRRLNYCIRVLAVELKSFWLFYWAARFQKYFTERFWEAAEDQILLQFSGLEDKGKFLALRGVKTVADLTKNVASVASWLQKGPSYETQLLEEANCY